jgi:hypothetical protein
MSNSRASSGTPHVLDTPQPYPRPASLGIDEVDAYRLEHAADGLIIDPGELGAGRSVGILNSQYRRVRVDRCCRH